MITLQSPLNDLVPVTSYTSLSASTLVSRLVLCMPVSFKPQGLTDALPVPSTLIVSLTKTSHI